MVWHSHCFKNFPLTLVLHTDKGFSIVIEAKVDAFLQSPCFFYDPTGVGNLISGSSALSNQLVHLEVLSACTAETYLEGF